MGGPAKAGEPHVVSQHEIVVKNATTCIAALAEATRQMPEFKSAFDAFLSKYELSHDGKLPTANWHHMFQVMYQAG